MWPTLILTPPQPSSSRKKDKHTSDGLRWFALPSFSTSWSTFSTLYGYQLAILWSMGTVMIHLNHTSIFFFISSQYRVNVNIKVSFGDSWNPTKNFLVRENHLTKWDMRHPPPDCLSSVTFLHYVCPGSVAGWMSGCLRWARGRPAGRGRPS